jgi:hypothetical protein
MPKDVHSAFYVVPCPRCRARAKHPCHTPSSDTHWAVPHLARQKAAKNKNKNEDINDGKAVSVPKTSADGGRRSV